MQKISEALSLTYCIGEKKKTMQIKTKISLPQRKASNKGIVSNH